jgi:ammonia channel protein AmtB
MINNVYDVVLWVLFAVTVATVLWYVFGNSPTFEQGMLILILTLLFSSHGDLRENKIRLQSLEKSFGRLVTDFKEHKKHK